MKDLTIKLILAVAICWAAIHLVFALPLILALAFIVPLIGGAVLFVSVAYVAARAAVARLQR
jgi:hypothetical protein